VSDRSNSDNPWLERRVLNYAHQGGAVEAPSSTLFAFERAVALGAEALEMDVHATADGELVVCHDATVDATTAATGAIAAMTLEEVRRLDNGYRFSVDGEFPYRGRAPQDRRFGVATLREVLEAFPGVFLNLDIKQTAPDVEPYEATLAAMLREFGRAGDVIVASFLDHATDAFSAVATEIHTSAGTNATADFWRAVQAGETPPPMRHVALQVPHRVAGTVVVDERFVAAAHQAGVAVHVWTIDDPAEMAELINVGVDGVMTDRPSVLETVLQECGIAYNP
jgi:glycerophosphoryl diester phosphodiesterase